MHNEYIQWVYDFYFDNMHMFLSSVCIQIIMTRTTTPIYLFSWLSLSNFLVLIFKFCSISSSIKIKIIFYKHLLKNCGYFFLVYFVYKYKNFMKGLLFLFIWDKKVTAVFEENYISSGLFDATLTNFILSLLKSSSGSCSLKLCYSFYLTTLPT